jgi:hypothetical protein
MRKIRLLGYLTLVGLMPLCAGASGPMCGAKSKTAWTGKLTAVNAEHHTITAKSWWHTRTFNVGEKCAISTMDKKSAALSDLRPGERVKVRYQTTGGVSIAEQISVEPLHVAGTVEAVNQTARTVTMEEPFHDRTLHLSQDCKIVLWNGKDGTLADLTPGNRVMVSYELPGGSPVAYRIHERTQTYVGKLDAIDLKARTVAASELWGNKQFNLADNCRIMAAGKANAHLSDLQLGHDYRFTYENVDGVNVVDRIAPSSGTKPATTASIK